MKIGSTTAHPALYWESRAQRFASRNEGLAAVCSYGMPWMYNYGMDLVQRRALLPILRRFRRGQALDVGCGLGRWSRRMAANGMTVTGLDISPFMVSRATQLAQQAGFGCRFVAAEVDSCRFEQRFDLILSVTVIQHLTEPGRAAAAIENLARHLAPKGHLVLLEAAPSEQAVDCDSPIFRARTEQWYAQALRQSGLELLETHGVDPMPLRRWALPYIGRVPKPLRYVAATLTAAASLPGDMLLAPRATRMSWHKVLVATQSGSGGG